MEFAKMAEVAENNNILSKIGIYSDARVSTAGVVSLDVRLAEVRERWMKRRKVTKEFYDEIERILSKDGFVATQADSPYYFLEGYTSIYKTMKASMPNTYPYLFPGSASGSMGYIISGKSLDPRISRNKNVEGLWYSPPDNDFLFKFPKFLQNYFANNSVQISTDDNPIVHVYMQNNYYFRGVADKPTE